MNGIEIETERKFLIQMPDAELLDELGGDEIIQTYLEDKREKGCSRVRSRRHGDVITYTFTEKQRISDISAHENERRISEEEYSALLEKREEGTETIRKKRYVLPYRGYDFEIDVYDFWHASAIMEVELPGEDAEFELPPGINIIREVSHERKFSNHSLARHVIPEEELSAKE